MNNRGVELLECNLLIKKLSSPHEATEFDHDIGRNLYNFVRIGWVGEQQVTG
jgi:hypothetical protein